MARSQTTNALFRSAVAIVMLTILAGGLARLLSESRGSGQPVQAARADTWAHCLGTVPVAQNTTVTLGELSTDEPESSLTASAAKNLAYVSTETISIDPIKPELKLLASGKEGFTLPKDTELRVQKGEFSFTGSAVAQVEGAALLLRTPDRLRFGPAPNSSYIVALSNSIEVAALVEGQPNSRALPPGTTGTSKLGGGKRVPLVALDAFAAMPLLLNSSSSLVPIRVFGEKGPSALSIETRQQSLTAKTLTACAIAQGVDYPLAVTDIVPGTNGIMNVVFSVPSSVLPDSSFRTLVDIAVASSDGRYTAHGSFVVFSRLYASLIATLCTGLLFWALLYVRHVQAVPNAAARKRDWGRFFAGLFVSGQDKDPSLSLFQIFFWTVITAWGFFYTFVVTGSLLKMTVEMMALLGIAGTGSVLARWIAVAKGSTSQPVVSAVSAADAERVEPLDFWQILNTNGQFDLLKLQLLLFTLLIGAYVICRIVDTASFPVLDTNTLLLLGVSQGIYIGGKLGGSTALSRAQAIKLELDLATEAVATLPNEIKESEANKDALKKEKELLNQEIQTFEKTTSRTDEQSAKLSTLRKKVLDKDAAIAALETTLKKKNADLSSANDRIKQLKPSLEQAIKEIGLAT
ncbi:hypothetical protein GOA77_13585 [Sinorhizobium meliloti]|uniref:hypothetical protein n=1 Tax=Rhizobium meliloti TaxID=382 RepID=UPI00031569A2|nr:hypothetical protein [Sinorhizobium meliloti]MDE3761837.1 hypothetical protein [Sinorhizobium meliloti]MDW9902887.1 hypothetical protein [Sinorhizobium meliloti]RVI87553.1 hypothetical protein CN188_01985 [Sinorhizobium meliloti]RVP27557.1 hypothetical protein CN082_17860 [Sinorhizobium meliloti]